MKQAKVGDTVHVHYMARLEDGTHIDNSKKRKPVEITLRKQGVLSGFSEGIVGMAPGETKTITLPPEKASGVRRKEFVFDIDQSEIPGNITPVIGGNITVNRPDGKAANATVTNIDENRVTVDANDPLAGKTLIFKVELLEIKSSQKKDS